MTLLTRDVARTIPPLYSQDDEDDPMLVTKFFLPGTRWSWFVIEGAMAHPRGCGWGEACDHRSLASWFEHEENDAIFFGYVHGAAALDDEFGYFRLSELEAIRVEVPIAGALLPPIEAERLSAWSSSPDSAKLRVERDLDWSPCHVSEVRS